MPSSDPLPPKENALFRKILKCYEMKQYKNGLKLAKQILSNPKYQEHGETLAMKGLTLNCLGRKDEAYDHVRRGLRNDLKSHVCWHVYGLLQRSDKKYDEAIKCYRNALKWEKDNIQILRDLSLLQIQMRDLEGYRETRYQLFKLRPSQHASWIGFAMSYHLLGDFDTANSILETFRSSQNVENYDYKHSELLLYQNQVIQESGNLEKALKHLRDHQSQILDKLVAKEMMGELCLKLRHFDEAEPIYLDLIKRNPDNSKYFYKYLEAKQITDPKEVVEFYKAVQVDYPHSLCVKRLPLDFATGDDFKALMDKYLQRNLRKGVPPLFVNVRSLYKDQEKIKITEELLAEYVETLMASGHFTKANKEADVEREPASALLWTYYYLAQHHDYLRNTDKALEYINLAIDHTPTLIELFVCKGRIYKHAGDPNEAYKWLDEAQSLDTADRYINSKCAKYMLRANKIKESEDMCAKFTREGVSAMENLNEMQCMWFQTECALASKRMEQWGEALKKCHEIERHFAEIIEDQFDFHTYCMRKMTLRSYVGLLRLEDVLREHPFYFRAAKCAIEVYIKLFDCPLKPDSTTEENNMENLSPSELKKLRNKQRKAKKKAELENAQAAQAQIKKEQYNKSRQQQNQDGDPESPQLDELIPEKLARPENPLEKAIEFLRPLQSLAKNNIETHLLAFEIYYRKNKMLLMLQSLKRAFKIDPNNPSVFTALIRYQKLLESNLANLDANVKTVIEEETKVLFNGLVGFDMIKHFYEKNQKCPASVLETAKCLYFLDNSKKKLAVERLESMMELSGLALKHALYGHDLLKSGFFGDCDAELKTYREKCHKKFPYAIDFQDAPIEDNIAEE